MNAGYYVGRPLMYVGESRFGYVMTTSRSVSGWQNDSPWYPEANVDFTWTIIDENGTNSFDFVGTGAAGRQTDDLTDRPVSAGEWTENQRNYWPNSDADRGCGGFDYGGYRGQPPLHIPMFDERKLFGAVSGRVQRRCDFLWLDGGAEIFFLKTKLNGTPRQLSWITKSKDYNALVEMFKNSNG